MADDLPVLVAVDALSKVEDSAVADLNADGRVNSIDAALVLQFDAGLLEGLSQK